MWKYLYSIKWTAPPVPTVLELYKIHSIIRMLISHFHKIVCHIQWIHTPGIIPALVQYVKNPNLWWNIPCEWTQVRRWKVLSRTITRYNICVRTKRRLFHCQINTRNPWVLVSVVLVQHHHKFIVIQTNHYNCLPWSPNMDFLQLWVDQSGKALLHLCCRKGKLNYLDDCFNVKKDFFFWLSRRNAWE